MTTAEKLRDRIFHDLGLSVEIPERVQRGRHGKAAGQWAWTAKATDRGIFDHVGSEDTMSECLGAKNLSYSRGRDWDAQIIIHAENG
jgi:hypothetical protein